MKNRNSFRPDTDWIISCSQNTAKEMKLLTVNIKAKVFRSRDREHNEHSNWPRHVTKTCHLASRQNRSHLCLHFWIIQTSKRLTKTNSRRPLFRLRQAGPPIQSQFSCIRTAFSFSSMGMFFSTGREARTSQFIRLLSICTKIPKNVDFNCFMNALSVERN